ncbi:hypothetical protein CPB86DRAFT_443478 [Serendipita vermifera]|nr:hypothetical protein CPB86DRAFT_443478 [Serendipita vermifera]
MTLKEVNGPQPGKVAKSALSRIQSFQRLWDDEFSESAVAPSSQTSDRAIPWSPSPDRQSTSNGKISAKQFDASIRLQRELQNGVAALANSKANFETKASKVSSSNKNNNIQNSNVAVSRPEKRKVEMVLSDDEAEPIPKRRPAPPPSSASNSVPTSSANKIQPWDMKHSTMKPPTNQSVSGTATVNTKKPVAELVELSNQQKEILDVVMDGKNVFFTGSAGTGKSVLLRSIIKSMRKKYFKSSDAVAVTASTGIAACNIGGITLHSFGGVGLGTESAPELAAKVRKNPKANTRWVRTKALIIDESKEPSCFWNHLSYHSLPYQVSMLEGDFFDKLEHVARLVRKKPEPFGGIQASLIWAIHTCHTIT